MAQVAAKLDPGPDAHGVTGSEVSVGVAVCTGTVAESDTVKMGDTGVAVDDAVGEGVVEGKVAAAASAVAVEVGSAGVALGGNGVGVRTTVTMTVTGAAVGAGMTVGAQPTTTTARTTMRSTAPDLVGIVTSHWILRTTGAAFQSSSKR